MNLYRTYNHALKYHDVRLLLAHSLERKNVQICYMKKAEQIKNI